MKKFAAIVVVLIMLGGIVGVVTTALQTRSHKASGGSPSPPSAQKNGFPDSTPQPGVKPPREDQYLAVATAATALNELRRSVLTDRRERWNTVRAWVYPAHHNRNKVFNFLNRETQWRGNKPPIWLSQQWNYPTALLAFVRSGYKVNVRYFHVDYFRPGVARIAIYRIQNWQSAEKESFNQVWLAIDTMRWKKDRWFFVREKVPAPNRLPNLNGGKDLTFDEVQNLYKPKLQGFTEYKPPEQLAGRG
jgi:hypothetical protein